MCDIYIDKQFLKKEAMSPSYVSTLLLEPTLPDVGAVSIFGVRQENYAEHRTERRQAKTFSVRSLLQNQSVPIF
jgi:hypothetical protein